MKYNEFVNTYLGKATDYDGSYGTQCVDLIKLYLDKVFDIKIGAIGNAHCYYDNYNSVALLKNNFTRIANTADFVPLKGDICVWNTKQGNGCGHIAIATGEGDTSNFYSYDQNWNVKAMTKVKHTYSNFSGVLRANDISKLFDISYEVHIQNLGWTQGEKFNGDLAGTEGESLRIEAIKINADVPIKYKVHIENQGWSDYVSNGEVAGTTGQSLRLEAIEIISDYNIKAQAHVQNEGWQEAVTGTTVRIGTEGQALRLEALKLEFA